MQNSGILIHFGILLVLSLATGQQAPHIPNLQNIRNAQVILHIGPHKTATTHIQATLVRLKNELYEDGWCYPVESQSEYQVLGVDLRSGKEPSDTQLVNRIRACLANGKKVIFSSEKLTELESEEGLQKIYSFLHGYSVHVIATHREFISSTYSQYNQHYKNEGKDFDSFSDSLVRAWDTYRLRVLPDILFRYADLYGLSNMTVIDFHGVLAMGKDFSYVFLCELLETQCTVKYISDERPNASVDLKPYWLLLQVFQTLSSLDCDIRVSGTEIQPTRKTLLTFLFTHLELSHANLSSLPVHLVPAPGYLLQASRSFEKMIREKFQHVLVYSNVSAFELARLNSAEKIVEVDEIAFMEDDFWNAWLWKKVRDVLEHPHYDGIVFQHCRVRVLEGIE